MSGLSRTPGKRVYGENRTEGSNPSFSAKLIDHDLEFDRVKKIIKPIQTTPQETLDKKLKLTKF